MKKILMSFILVSLMLAFFSGPVLASQTDASASLDWTNLTKSSNITLSGFSTSLTAQATNLTQDTTLLSASTPSWPITTYALPATVTLASATASGLDAAKQLSSVTSATSDVVNDAHESWATATRTATFTVDKTGNVWFSIPYTLSFTATASSGADSWAQAAASYKVILTCSDPQKSALAIGDLYYDGQSQSGYSYDFANVLVTGLRKGDTGTISFQTASYSGASAVPIPAGLWLLGSGLIGLVGIRRKFSK